jgi:SAM-dependent methyltransferase
LPSRPGDGETEPAWRETAICRCGTEATTGFFRALSRLRRGTVGSEHIPDRAAPGTIDPSGVRCDYLERLSFADASFDYVVSLDMLEHVFSYEAALREMLRVLKSGGVAIITVPFNWGQLKTVRRAQVDGGGVRHLLPPIYHSDPVNKDGALLVFDYGWDLLGVMYAIGWQDVHFTHVWSESRKYFGRNFILRGLKA